ncbi:GNAT family N-acetyltransferase [Dechloromonas denitrificans]|nr:GNAT family N-acetyltransferase [Dechloromonas denitrificans]
MMEDFTIAELDWNDQAAVATARELVIGVFDNPLHYSATRIGEEFAPALAPLQRCFFVAYQGGGMVGAGGIKSADWASHTHLLYLSVVLPAARGQGIGRELVKSRLAWLRQNNAHGRVLVSTVKARRFLGLGFRQLNRRDIDGKSLMFLEY